MNDSLEKYFRLSPSHKQALSKLSIKNVKDLLFYFPIRYGDTANVQSISGSTADTEAIFFGKITKIKTSKGFKSKMPMAEGILEDETDSIKIVWFNQPYLAKMISPGTLVRVEGKILERKGEKYLSNPKIEKITSLPIGVGESLFSSSEEIHLYPIYPETKGITSNWLYHATQRIFASEAFKDVIDPIPKEILEKYNLPTLKTALIWIHGPKNKNDALSARKRFSFEEVFFIQLKKLEERKSLENKETFVINPKEEIVTDFIERFPFSPTSAQLKAMEDIMTDFRSGKAMSRLLEGDVGSGKTAVAALAVYSAIMTRPAGKDFGALQAAYMAPTEILAKQHFESFIKYFTHLGVSVGLITGSGCRKFPSKVDPGGWTTISRAQLLKWVANGEIPILIGTHALIQKSVIFKNLALVIIDEQHRFGTAQRQKLARKDDVLPHLLSMTATPIPRTLALTIYGDLDITLLDEMPAGRKPIITEIVLQTGREKTYEKIREEITAGRQVYVICPRIDEPDPNKEMALNVKSVTEEAKRLKKKVFPNQNIAILHSKMTNIEKEKTMKAFEDGKINILVSTSVVEVGVNVPNATVMIIEGAERFGLSQLHQLRGRVVRSNHQAYCYIFAETKSDKTIKRLNNFKKAKNGFELAEFDLQERGSGALYGGKQWGITDLGMEALQNLKMVEAARNEARRLLSSPEGLTNLPLLQSALSDKKEIHFE